MFSNNSGNIVLLTMYKNPVVLLTDITQHYERKALAFFFQMLTPPAWLLFPVSSRPPAGAPNAYLQAQPLQALGLILVLTKRTQRAVD